MSHETARSHHVVEDPAEERLCRALKSLPARIPPASLTTSLRVIASRERQRFLERRTPWQALAVWYDRMSLTTGQMMRSAILPVSGGVFTAVILFSTWLVPTYPLHAKNSSDVPTMLSTEASVEDALQSLQSWRFTSDYARLSGGDAVVDVTVDDQGQVVDYAIVSGTEMLQDPGRRQKLMELLLWTHFTPATEFGRPIASKIRLPVLSSQIDVKD